MSAGIGRETRGMSELDGSPWWDPGSKEPPHRRLIPLVRNLLMQQATRYENMRRMVTVYEHGFETVGNTWTNLGSLRRVDGARLHFNVAKNAMDTLLSQVCGPRVSPMLMTDGGTWLQRERARLATKAVEGVLADNNGEEIREDIALDAQTAYCGFAFVYSECTEEGVARIRVERVNPQDVVVDEAEGRDRRPRCIYRRHYRDRYWMLAKYGGPDKDLYGAAKTRSDAIKKAPKATPWTDATRSQSQDTIEVWEAWHLPSGHESDDGRHTIAVVGCTLFDEEWERDAFPVAVYRPEKAREGFWGLAAMEQALAGQREYERVTEKLQRQHKAYGTGLVVYGGAAVNVKEMTNGVGTVMDVNGPPGSVQPLTPTPANPQTYQYREGISGDILRYLGISEYSAQSSIPEGMAGASGKAMQLVVNEESKRNILRHRAMERFVVELAELVIDEARCVMKRGYKVNSRYRAKTGFENVDWADIVDVVQDRDAYVVQTFPVGMLAQSPAAKFAQLDALLERQVITVDQFKRLFEMPDLAAEIDVDASDSEVLQKTIDKMVLTGRYTQPQPFDDFKLLLGDETGGGGLGRKLYNAYRSAGVPEDRLELVRMYLVDAKALQDRAKASAAPTSTGMAPAPNPQAAAGAPPALPPGMPPVAA